MTNETTFRFKFEIINDETGETVIKDWTLFCADQIGPFGCVDSVDIHTGSMLRYLRKHIEHKKLQALLATSDDV